MLETQLQTEGRNVEVLNTGVSGWGTDQQYLYFKSEGHLYQPDVVVLAFYVLNDFLEIMVSRQHGHNKPFFRDLELTRAGVPVPKGVEGVALERSGAKSPALAAAIIEHLAADCRAQGARLVVMTFGSIFRPINSKQLAAYTVPFYARLAALRQVPLLDLDREFRAQGLRGPRLTGGNRGSHWNAFAHRRAAQSLQQFLNAEGLLPEPAPQTIR